MKSLLSDFLTNESGQGITEYGAILAFVAILVAVVFSITQGALSSAISKAFSAVVSQLNHLSAAAGNASS
jgi:Flp pilus assembly pilin Flp